MAEIGAIEVRLDADPAPLVAGFARAVATLDGFERAAARAEDSMNAFGRQLGAIAASASTAGTALGRAEVSARGFAASVGDAARRMREVGDELTTRVSLPLAAFGTGAVLAAGQSDRLVKGLEAVTGSTAEAGRQLDRLREIARRPGLGFEEVVRASTGLQAIGLEAGTAERAIAELGNALALTGGTRDDFAEVVRQFTQINSLGKVTAENLNVIRERAPAISGALQAAFEGVDLTKLPIEEFNRVLLVELAKLERAAPSLLEPFTNALDDLRQAVVPLGEAIARTLTPALEKATALAQSASVWFRGLSPEMQSLAVAIGSVAVVVGPIVAALGTLGIAGSALAGGLAVVKGAVVAAGVALATLSAPVVIAITVVGGLIAAFVLFRRQLYVVNQQISNLGLGLQVSLLGAFASVADAAAGVLRVLGRFVPGLASAGVAAETLARRLREAQASARLDLSAGIDQLRRLQFAATDAGRALEQYQNYLRSTRPDFLLSGTGGARFPGPPEPAPLDDSALRLPAVDEAGDKVKTLAERLADVQTQLRATLTGIATRIRDGLVEPIDAATERVQAYQQAYDAALSANEGRASAASSAIRAQLREAEAALAALGGPGGAALSARLARLGIEIRTGLSSPLEVARERAAAIRAAFETAAEGARGRLTPAVADLAERLESANRSVALLTGRLRDFAPVRSVGVFAQADETFDPETANRGSERLAQLRRDTEAIGLAMTEALGRADLRLRDTTGLLRGLGATGAAALTALRRAAVDLASALAEGVADAVLAVADAFSAAGSASYALDLLDAREAIERLSDAFADGAISAERYHAELAVARERLDDLEAAANPVVNAARTIAGAFKAAMADVIRSIIEALAKAALLSLAFKLLGVGGAGTGFFSIFQASMGLPKTGPPTSIQPSVSVASVAGLGQTAAALRSPSALALSVAGEPRVTASGDVTLTLRGEVLARALTGYTQGRAARGAGSVFGAGLSVR